MDRFRLRGTWEDDPAPIPFPAGRDADAKPSRPDPAELSGTELSESVESELDFITYRFNELRELFGAGPDDDDSPTAA